MTSLIERERLIRVSDKVTYHTQRLQAVQQIVIDHLRANNTITVGELRDRLGVSRKYALALLEHFDNIAFTKRDGDGHVMR